MKLNSNKEKNYAYNINSTTHNLANKKITFKMLNRNFYEELISSDYNLKHKKTILSNIKNNSIKECVYCNKEIPKTWKTILDYRDEVYKAIDQDPDFAHYIGRSNKEERTNDFFETKLKSVQHMAEEGSSNKPNIKTGEILKEFKDSFVEDKSKKELNKTKNLLLEIESNNNEEPIKFSNLNLQTISTSDKKDISTEKTGKDSFFYKGRSTHHFMLDKNNDLILNDKFISNKLDEYRSKYDMKKFMNEIRQRRTKEGKDKEVLNYVPHFISEKRNNYREFLKGKTQNNKECVLKSSIYSSLLPENEYNKTFNGKFNLPRINEKKFNPEKTTPQFLNQHLEFDTPIEITNPKVKRDLELINYFGPRYTNCHVCNRRNLEFYQNSEPKQALVLLNYLKKVKLGEEEDNAKKNKE